MSREEEEEVPKCYPGRTGHTKKYIVEWIANHFPHAAIAAEKLPDKTELCKFLNSLIKKEGKEEKRKESKEAKRSSSPRRKAERSSSPSRKAKRSSSHGRKAKTQKTPKKEEKKASTAHEKKKKLLTLEEIKAERTRKEKPSLTQKVLEPGSVFGHVLSFSGYKPLAALTTKTSQYIKEAKERECEIQPVWNSKMQRYVCELQPEIAPHLTPMGYPCCNPWELTSDTIVNFIRASGQLHAGLNQVNIPMRLLQQSAGVGGGGASTLSVPEVWIRVVPKGQDFEFSFTTLEDIGGPFTIGVGRLRKLWKWLESVAGLRWASSSKFNTSEYKLDSSSGLLRLQDWESTAETAPLGWIRKAFLVEHITDETIIRKLEKMKRDEISYMLTHPEDLYGPAVAQQAGRFVVARWLASRQKEIEPVKWIHYAVTLPDVSEEEILRVFSRLATWNICRFWRD